MIGVYNQRKTARIDELKGETKDRKARVGIIGFGVVGCATGRGLKHILGHEVYINDLKNLEEYRKEFNILVPYDLSKTDITLFTLPTPTKPLALEGKIDLNILEQVTEKLGEQLKYADDYHVFVTRSTVPPGTTMKIGKTLENISGKILGEDFGIATNPEFLRAYNSEEDFKNPRLLIIGEYDERSGNAVEKLYEKLHAPIMRMGLNEAEMVKYTHNNFNAAKISYFNEIWEACEILGVDFETIRKAVTITSEAMWNPDYGTHGGRPYGGTCLPKDTTAMHSYLKERGFTPKLLEAIIRVNEEVKGRNGDHIETYFKERMHETYDNLPPLK